MSKKLISLILTVVLSLSPVLGSYAEKAGPETVPTELFVRQELFRQYSLIYDTFSAAVTLEDGSEITGMGFTDYASYCASEEGTGGFFPAGFIADCGYEIPAEEAGKGLVIENLDFSDEQHGYVYGYETAPFTEHCVRDGQYLKYGVNELGAMTYEAVPYERGVCDESLGALYSYDAGKFVFDPDMGNYVRISGTTLFDQIDFAALESRMNEIIENQNIRFSQEEIASSAYFAQEAVVSYLLSLQEETFLGYKVSELAEAAARLDPTQCIRITPDGFVYINADENAGSADDTTKWLVGTACFILAAGSVALQIYVPAARPLCNVMMRSAVSAFMQVVIQSRSLAEVQWGKIAVSAVSGAVLAWACPLAADSVTEAAVHAGAGETLGKLAGYGVLTVSKSVVSGVTKMIEAKLDGEEADWNVFKNGALIGAASSVAMTAFTEFMPRLGARLSVMLSRVRPGEWLGKFASQAEGLIQGKRVQLESGPLESVLGPKAVHLAALSARMALNALTGAGGGSYKTLTGDGDGTVEKHEILSQTAYKTGLGLDPAATRDQTELPAIRMSAADHRRTAGFGLGAGAADYRARQAAYIAKGDFPSAIWMDVEDIRSNFGSKYDEELRQALVYAARKGLWTPWDDSSGISKRMMESLDLSLEELTP